MIRPEKDLSLWKQVSSFECNEIKELPLKDKDEEQHHLYTCESDATDDGPIVIQNEL